MRRWWLVVAALGGCRVGFDVLQTQPTTGLHALISTVAGLTVVEAYARLEFATLDPRALRGIDVVPGEATFALPDESGPLRVVVAARDPKGHWFTSDATTDVIAETTQDVYVVVGDALAPSCIDGVRNGNESAADCGGTCAACAIGDSCAGPLDCASGSCLGGLCEPVGLAWSAIAAMPAPRIGLGTAVGSDGRIYAYGGSIGDTTPELTAYAYDPTTDAWSVVPSLGAARTRTTGAAVTGSLYAIGGFNASYQPLTTVERYTPGDPAWTPITPMPSARAIHASATDASGSLYAIGGAGTGTLVTSYLGGVWSTRAPLPLARTNLAAARMSDGRIIAVGGHNAAVTMYYANADAFDPMMNTWTSLPPLALARSDLSAVAAPDGRIYAMGGFVGPSNALDQVEAYRPGAPAWVSIAPLSSVRDSSSATIGPDGRIYVMGGRGSAALTSVATYGPKLTLAPATGEPNAVISAAGASFGPNADVRMYFDNIPIELVSTDAAGTFTGVTFQVPPLAPGQHVIRAVDDRAGFPVTTPFTIQ